MTYNKLFQEGRPFLQNISSQCSLKCITISSEKDVSYEHFFTFRTTYIFKYFYLFLKIIFSEGQNKSIL